MYKDVFIHSILLWIHERIDIRRCIIICPYNFIYGLWNRTDKKCLLSRLVNFWCRMMSTCKGTACNFPNTFVKLCYRSGVWSERIFKKCHCGIDFKVTWHTTWLHLPMYIKKSRITEITKTRYGLMHKIILFIKCSRLKSHSR